MQISQYLDQLTEWGSDDREHYLRPLLAILTPVSLQSLRQLEVEHFAKAKADYPAFVASQNREIIKCLHLEISGFGTVVRGECGLKPLTLDTEIPIHADDCHNGKSADQERTMDATQIKAELWDLEPHHCDGKFTCPACHMRADGRQDRFDRRCPSCIRIIELQKMLAELESAQGTRNLGV